MCVWGMSRCRNLWWREQFGLGGVVWKGLFLELESKGVGKVQLENLDIWRFVLVL